MGKGGAVNDGAKQDQLIQSMSKELGVLKIKNQELSSIVMKVKRISAFSPAALQKRLTSEFLLPQLTAEKEAQKEVLRENHLAVRSRLNQHSNCCYSPGTASGFAVLIHCQMSVVEHRRLAQKVRRTEQFSQEVRLRPPS